MNSPKDCFDWEIFVENQKFKPLGSLDLRLLKDIAKELRKGVFYAGNVSQTSAIDYEKVGNISFELVFTQTNGDEPDQILLDHVASQLEKGITNEGGVVQDANPDYLIGGWD